MVMVAAKAATRAMFVVLIKSKTPEIGLQAQRRQQARLCSEGEATEKTSPCLALLAHWTQMKESFLFCMFN